MNSDSIKSFIQQNFQTLGSEDALFDELALEIFAIQKQQNPVYREYLQLTGLDAVKPLRASEIPCLPVQLFKNKAIQTGDWTPQDKFLSSGTTGMEQSFHLVRDPVWYDLISRQIFEYFYGEVTQYCFLALLPGYLERKGSSLITMMNRFIHLSQRKGSGFFLRDTENLLKQLRICIEERKPTFLFGVSFALWELAEAFPMNLEAVKVMETGGMKGRRREITRKELHGILKDQWQIESVHSEYGMTELFSQGYSKADGLFRPGPTMRVFPRDMTDPFGLTGLGKTAALNVVDLANIDTISFIATEDLGKCHPEGDFEVLGRLDNSDIRGCNLLLG